MARITLSPLPHTQPTKRLRIRRYKKGLPPTFWGHPLAKGLVADFDIRLSISRLKAKVLVFRNTVYMKRFWRLALDRPVVGALACCSSLIETKSVIEEDGTISDQWNMVDPVYYCVIGYNLPNLDCEILCHESVHAAYSFRERYHKPIPKEWGDNPEEDICYPAGAIMAKTLGMLKDLKLVK